MPVSPSAQDTVTATPSLQHVGRVAAADHRRNAQLARDDRRVAGAPAAVGDDRRGALHHRLPVRVGHVGDQHVARLDLVHLGGIVRPRAPDRRRSSGRWRGPSASTVRGALELVAQLGLACCGLALHRLGTRLQDVELAVAAVLAPLDVHRPAVVLFDDDGVTAPVRARRRRRAKSGCAARRRPSTVVTARPLRRPPPAREHHLDQLGAQAAADDRAYLPAASVGLWT